MNVGAKQLNLFKNLEKEKIMLCVQYVVSTLALVMVVKMTSASITQRLKHKRFLYSTQNKKKVNQLQCNYSNSQFRPKINKIWTTFCRLLS